jgi:pimeloyl-ACP methyl ester carboxylesterase
MSATSYFFRQSGKQLFGCYHLPRGAARGAVLLCQPQGAEYQRCHRAFRLLADQLARAGLAALRFDYFGSGDSAGDGIDGDLDQWRRDVAAALEECRTRWGHTRIAAVGLRLGATLAVLAAQDAGLLDALVLWEPVVSGRAYLDDLEARHRAFRRTLPQGGPESAAPAGWAELAGFLYSPRLLAQLAQLDLQAATVAARRTLVLETTAGSVPAIESSAERATIPGSRIWFEDADRALVPTSSLQAIVRWLSGVMT